MSNMLYSQAGPKIVLLRMKEKENYSSLKVTQVYFGILFFSLPYIFEGKHIRDHEK